jgi:dynein heavy chain
LPVEEPLVKKKIEDMEKEITPGITTHKWKSADEINKFIGRGKNNVD